MLFDHSPTMAESRRAAAPTGRTRAALLAGALALAALALAGCARFGAERAAISSADGVYSANRADPTRTAAVFDADGRP